MRRGGCRAGPANPVDADATRPIVKVSDKPIPRDGWMPMLPKKTIRAFDLFLEGEGLRLDAVVVGGSALALLGLTDRATRDFDILAPDLPDEIVDAARRFAEQQRAGGVALADDWLNNGPIQLGDILPVGWRDRLQLAWSGQAVVLNTLGRTDLLRTKLFALCDRGTDLADCIALGPSFEELTELEPWVAAQDANPQWPDHVCATLQYLRDRMHDGA